MSESLGVGSCALKQVFYSAGMLCDCRFEELSEKE